MLLVLVGARAKAEYPLDKPGSAGVPAGELVENYGKVPARRRRSQAEHAYLSAMRHAPFGFSPLQRLDGKNAEIP